MSSPIQTSERFYPRCQRERLEWAAARQKERYSQHPSCVNNTDYDWILRVSPGTDCWMTVPVLDPNCKVTIPVGYYEGGSAENYMIPAPYTPEYGMPRPH